MSRTSRKLLRHFGVAGFMAGLVAMPLLATVAPAGADTPNPVTTTTASTAGPVTNTNVPSGGTLHGLADGEVVNLHITAPSASQLFGIIDARQCDTGANIIDSASMIPSNTGLCLDRPFPGSKGQESTGNQVKAASTDTFIDVSFRVGAGRETVEFDDGHPTLQHNDVTCNSASPVCTLWVEISTDAGSEFVHFNLEFAPPAPSADFNGDGRSDPALFRPATGQWIVHGQFAVPFGAASDVPVPGDYDGNRRIDVAVYRPATGQWFVDGQFVKTLGGQPGDVPIPADYNGDGRTDIAIFRPSTGQWLVHGLFVAPFGQDGDVPIPADYDGDGSADLAVYRPGTHEWFVNGLAHLVWGDAGDLPVPQDYDGDGKTDVALYRPSTGQWIVLNRSNTTFGGNDGDIPLGGDFDGDGRADLTIYRPTTGQFFVNGQFVLGIGQPGDLPL